MMSFLLSIVTMMSVIEVKWLNTDVDVVLNDEISAYVDIPEARLYIDGTYIHTEANYIYNGVNRTFLSVINTNYVKTYQLDYEVYFPLYDIKDTKTVYFHVIDDTSPKFIHIPTYEIEVGDAIPDLYLNIVYEDNYDDVEDMNLNIDQSYINNDHVGSYPIYYDLYDSSYNQCEAVRYINVVDRISPHVSIKKTLELDVGAQGFDPYDYFKISDNVDDQLTVYVDDTSIQYDQIGTYDFSLYVSDLSNNTFSQTYQIQMIDQEEPSLDISKNPTLAVGDIEALDHLDAFIIAVRDNYDDLSINDVVVTHDINIHRLGTYEIIYTVADQSYNLAESKVSVKVIDEVSPIIKINEPLAVEVHGLEPFLITYFDIEDNYDAFNQLDIDIDTTINMDKIGSYQVIVSVEDTSKNVANYYGYIEVVDTKPPLIELLNDILITNFEAIDYTSYVSFTDNYDEEITNFTFDDQHILYHEIGKYPLTIHAYDASNNQSILTVDVMVVDIIEPTIELSTSKVYVSLGENIDDLNQYIVDAFDNYDALGIEDVYTTGKIDEQTIGRYDISYHLIDQSLNHHIAHLSVYVDDHKQPEVYMTDLIIEQNQAIDYEAGIEVIDDLPYQIAVDKNYIDPSKVGIQYITYYIVDARGNYTTYIRKVVIKPKDEAFDIYQYMPLIIIDLLGLATLTFVYKQYH